VNRGAVLAAGAVAVEKGLRGAFVHEATGHDSALLVVDRHGARLNDGPAKSVLAGTSLRPSRAKAGYANRRVVKMAPAILRIDIVLILILFS
jgi:hypothetical protein